MCSPGYRCWCNPTVGAFLVFHRPKNPVGWILCGMGLVFEIGAFAGAYADYALSARPGSVHGGILMLWVNRMGECVGIPERGVVGLAVPPRSPGGSWLAGSGVDGGRRGSVVGPFGGRHGRNLITSTHPLTTPLV
jgi:hypothetical protein